jgi:hypothetical protein
LAAQPLEEEPFGGLPPISPIKTQFRPSSRKVSSAPTLNRDVDSPLPLPMMPLSRYSGEQQRRFNFEENR